MNTTIEIIQGTAAMLSFAMCVLVLVFLIQLLRINRINAGKVYKDWILFTGITLTVTSLIYSAAGEPYLVHCGFFPEQIQLLAIYNSFVRFIGVSFLFTWAALFEAFAIGERILELFKRKKEA